MSDSTITRVSIHPGIGIARVGNSQDAWYFGPETPNSPIDLKQDYRDASGALKRQAARFRLYGYNAAGEVVRELTDADGDIRWTVHVANRKAAWYNFNTAMDIAQAVPSARRNASLTGTQRQQLMIDAGHQSINSSNPSSVPLNGKFFDQNVSLGELRLDDDGRLIFLGGSGKSAPVKPTVSVFTYANNDGWYDDTSDGPVHAEITLRDGTKITAESAWVAVAPPNFGTYLTPIITIYDLMIDALINNRMTQPSKPSFTKDIYPILSRFSQMQWVNKGFFVQFGWNGPHDFEKRLTDLADPKRHQELRRQIFNQFRFPHFGDALIQFTAPNNRNVGEGQSINAWPWVYGDGGSFVDPSPNGFLAVTTLMYQYLGQWASGQFIADWKGPPPRQTLGELSLADQPHALDRAALESCIGGPFHPGSELPWVMRQNTLYRKPFRINERPEELPEPDYGDVLTPKQVFDLSSQSPAPSGPLFGQGPGDLTRWMAVPWQTDSAGCRSGYESDFDPYIPTYWPARVPNQVLKEADYEIVMDTSKPRQERLDAFRRRASWFRFLGPSADFLGQLSHMVSHFDDQGVIEPRPGIQDDADFPPLMYVEILSKKLKDQPALIEATTDDQGLIVYNKEKLTPKSGV